MVSSIRRCGGYLILSHPSLQNTLDLTVLYPTSALPVNLIIM
jgi:hypothetical protein